MRRLLTFLIVAAATAGGTTWWLYDGDLAEAVEPVVDRVHAWDADGLAVEAGLADPTGTWSPPPAEGG